MSPIFIWSRSPLRATAITTASYVERNRPARIVPPTSGQVLETTASRSTRSDRGPSSWNTWLVAGRRPRIFWSSTTESTTPTNTSRSPASSRSVGATAAITWPPRSISMRNSPSSPRSPASSIERPTSGLPGSTTISSEYCRGSSLWLIAGRRSLSSHELLLATKR